MIDSDALALPTGPRRDVIESVRLEIRMKTGEVWTADFKGRPGGHPGAQVRCELEVGDEGSVDVSEFGQQRSPFVTSPLYRAHVSAPIVTITSPSLDQQGSTDSG